MSHAVVDLVHLPLLAGFYCCRDFALAGEGQTQGIRKCGQRSVSADAARGSAASLPVISARFRRPATGDEVTCTTFSSKDAGKTLIFS